MAEGTRIRVLDDRLGDQEFKLGKISDTIIRSCEVNAQNFVDMNLRMDRMETRMDKMDSTLGELKELIWGLHYSPVR